MAAPSGGREPAPASSSTLVAPSSQPGAGEVGSTECDSLLSGVSRAEIDERYWPFMRTDPPLGVWGVAKMALATVTLLPIRVVAFVLAVVFHAIATLVIFAGYCDSERPVFIDSPLRYKAMVCVSKLCGYIGWFFYGMWFVKHSYYPSREAVEEDRRRGERAPTIVANHVSLLDLFVLGALYWPSWVTRDGNGRVPYFGRLTRSLNCIEIARGSSSSQSTQRIVARQREFYNHPLTPQLAIFPEGTTSNGTAILKFRRGAFVSGLPVLPVGIRYPYRNFNPSWESIPMLWWIWRLFTQYHLPLEVVHFPIYRPTEQEQADASLYAHNVHEWMVRGLAPIQSSDASFEDKQRYHQLILSGRLHWNYHRDDRGV